MFAVARCRHAIVSGHNHNGIITHNCPLDERQGGLGSRKSEHTVLIWQQCECVCVRVCDWPLCARLGEDETDCEQGMQATVCNRRDARDEQKAYLATAGAESVIPSINNLVSSYVQEKLSLSAMCRLSLQITKKMAIILISIVIFLHLFIVFNLL